jgi:hypothetical protein
MLNKYRVLPGKRFGLYRGGEIVEHEAKDAAPYIGTHLELVTEAEAKTAQPASVPLPASLARIADLNAEETIQAAKQLTAEERKTLLTWERANKRRVTIINALESKN